MKINSNVLSVLSLAAGIVIGSCGVAFSDITTKVAVVDVQTIVSKSGQVKELKKEQETKANELNKWLETVNADIKKQSTEANRKKLLKKYNEDLAKKKEANAKLYSSGFTQELDDYYYSKQEGIAKDKPHPQISAILSEILTVLNKSQTPDRVETANFLLDFSYEERKEFSSSVEELRKRIINSRKRACIYACPLDSNLPYVVFTSVPGLLDYTDREKEEKLLPQLKQDHYTSCWIFTISFHGTKIKKFDSRLFQLD